MVVFVDWSQLPKELLMRIVENHVRCVEEYIMFSCVCHSWQRAAHDCDKSLLRSMLSRRQMPWLMLTGGDVHDDRWLSPADKLPYFLHDGFYQDRGYLPLFSPDYYSSDDEVIVDDQDLDQIINGQAEADNMNDQIGSIFKDNSTLKDIILNYRSSSSSLGRVIKLSDSRILDNGMAFSKAIYYRTTALKLVDGSSSSSFDYERRALKLGWNINNNILIDKQYRFNLPQAHDKVCWGSPYGWIVTLSLDLQMEMLNPLTKARLSLPSQETCTYSWKGALRKSICVFNVNRAALLRLKIDDDDSPWLVVLFHRVYTVVSVAKPGDNTWKQIPNPVPDEKGSLQCRLTDVIYCSEMHSLLFVDLDGNLHSYDLHSNEQPQLLKAYCVKKPPEPFFSHQEKIRVFHSYIVRFNGSLLMLQRIRMAESSYSKVLKTIGFIVHKLDSLTHEWEELHDLNGATLFLGNNVTVAIPASDSGIRSNCIFFNDDYRSGYELAPDRLGGRDLGVYDMTERRVQHILNNEGVDHQQFSF